MNLYAKINLDAMKDAMNNEKLGHAGFKLWMYFAKNQDEYDLPLYPADAEKWGITKTTFYRTINVMVEEHYLVPDGIGTNRMKFVEYPAERKKRYGKE